ncbi:MAG: Transcription antitermination protein NusB [Chlamydiales bacterium]|nr:Transcription antitermination protein NusB [Chlamydiales bacterium]MCH9620429.1 Transcription antitermination protein NusB [Chlamydiales bacterium]MCH9622925.1 Transcription antitermination protein NusB [Chlamydiales bacterium]
MTSQKFRELVLQALFSIEMGGDDVLTLLMRQLAMSKTAVLRGITFAQQIFETREELDQIIAETSKEYDLDRIPVVEKNILRYALYEIEKQQQPPSFMTEEAIRLARKFSTPEAGTFIHALLAQLYPREEKAAS